MKNLSKLIDETLNAVLLKSENQHEFLMGACASDIKVTNTQEHILMLLGEQDLTNSDLSLSLGVSQAAVTKAVKVLVKEGLVEPQKHEKDARRIYFRLTEKAVPIAKEHAQHHEKTLKVYQGLLESYDVDEQAVIWSFLKDLKKELDSL